MTYDDAVAALYQAPHASFVAERKRLADELKAGGDKAAAAKLGKLGRPPLSAWAVNQLYWHARDGLDALLDTAGRLRAGDLSAQAAHREALASLRGRASRILADAGHAATEATLRKVTTTLSALAAAGGFDPDPPGALVEDREPPGFEVAAALASVPVRARPTVVEAAPAPEQEPEDEIDDEEEAARRDAAQRELEAGEAKGHAGAADHAEAKRTADDAEAKREADATADKRRAEEATRRANEAAAAEAKRKATEAKRAADEAAAEKRQVESARAMLAGQRSKVLGDLASARAELSRRERAVAELSAQLEAAEGKVAEAQKIIAALEAKLAELAPA